MYDAPNAVEELKRPYKPAPEYKVEAIKDALKDGLSVEGVQLVQNVSTIIK